MKIAPRIATAALAVAAIAAMPFVQSAPAVEAASGPDVHVEFDHWSLFMIEPGINQAVFAMRNIGPAPTSDLVVIKTCTYFQIASPSSDNKFSGMLDIVQPPVVQPALKQGEPRLVSVDCHRVSGKILKSVSLKIAAQPGEFNTADNQDYAVFSFGL
jgi:hypothetical protein